MRTSPLLLAPTVLSLLFLGSGHYVAGLELKDASKKGDHGADGPEVTVTSRIAIPSKSETSTVSELSSETDYDYSEEYDNEPQVSGSIVDDSVRVEQVVKPSQNQTESEKTSDKPKRRKKTGKNGKNRRNKKKKTPCDAEFQNFCIHGECKYIEHLTAVTCKCHQDYFGERCGEKTMKTQRIVNSDLPKVALVAVVAFVSAMILTVTVVVITSQLRKRYFSEYEGESEETKKLRKENNAHTIV